MVIKVLRVYLRTIVVNDVLVMMPKTSATIKNTLLINAFLPALLIITLWVAFTLRLVYLTRFDFHEDEFYSLLAISQTMERGAPVLPSGLFYDKGLAYSFLTALPLKLVGFNEALARWISVLAGILGIVAIFAAGRGLFGTTVAGLVAAFALAFDSEAIAWSSRARMYALAQMALPCLFWIAWRAARMPRQQHFLVALGLMAWSLLAHAGTAALMPALAVVGGLTIWLEDRISTVRAALTWPVGITSLLVAALALILIIGGSAAELPTRIVPDDPNLPLGFDSTTEPLSETLSEYLDFLLAGRRAILSTFAVGAGLWAIYQVGLVRSSSVVERTTFFVTLLFILSFITMLVLPSKEFKRDRNLFLLVLPQIYLLSGVGVHWLACLGSRFFSYQRLARGLAVMAFLGLAYPALTYLQPTTGRVRYDQAYAFVQANWLPGDIAIASRMAPCYLYLRRCDYYLREFGVRATNKFTGSYTDWYIGVPWVRSQSEFSQILASNPGTWFVIRDTQLSGNFTPGFIQQILSQMELVEYIEDMLVFHSRTNPIPLPEQPQHPVDWQWERGTRLLGYHTEQFSANELALTLFWQNLSPFDPFKIFVQLRSPDGAILAQADHIPWHDLPEILRRGVWGEGATIRDRVIVSLPPEVDLSRDRFIIGFYHPDSLERRPVINDESGEHGVWLGD